MAADGGWNDPSSCLNQNVLSRCSLLPNKFRLFACVDRDAGTASNRSSRFRLINTLRVCDHACQHGLNVDD